jgi:hypothetical protein
MQQRGKILVLAIVGLLLAFTTVLVGTHPQRRPNQPVYKGLILAQWLDIVVRHRINGYAPATISQRRQLPRDATPDQVHEAEDVVRALGTNALPSLLTWISYEPSSLRRGYRGVLDLLPLPDHTRAFLWGLPSTRHDLLAEFAIQGFRLLDTNAVPALPELSKMANDTTRPLTQARAAKALSTVTNALPQSATSGQAGGW